MTAGPTPPPPTVTVYWRPGCRFCASLRRRLRRAGLATEERNIWSDPEAAAFVRSSTGGDETVPTVAFAGTVLVNPSARRVVSLATSVGVPLAEVSARRWWRR